MGGGLIERLIENKNLRCTNVPKKLSKKEKNVRIHIW